MTATAAAAIKALMRQYSKYFRMAWSIPADGRGLSFHNRLTVTSKGERKTKILNV
jgi:hypothetical protein